jgi:hypothetical protein
MERSIEKEVHHRGTENTEKTMDFEQEGTEKTEKLES